LTVTKPARGWQKEVRDWTLTLGAAVVLSFLIQNYAFAQVKVEQHSMDYTLQEGQRLVENRFIYRFSDPSHGDIVIINGPESERRLVKRIVAIPGDSIDIREGALWVNGEKQEESYAEGRTKLGSVELPLELQKDQYFVLGDNREHSEDSRHFGPVSLSSLEGKAVLRLWPVTKVTVFD
jgi:signal peptidase I